MTVLKDFLSKKNATAIAAIGMISYTSELSVEKTICISVISIVTILVQGLIDLKKGDKEV
jgi:hypothetical protein